MNRKRTPLSGKIRQQHHLNPVDKNHEKRKPFDLWSPTAIRRGRAKWDQKAGYEIAAMDLCHRICSLFFPN